MLLHSLNQDLGIDLSEDEVILFFQKFDKGEQRKLKYSDFCDAFAPKDKESLNELALRVPRHMQLQMSYNEMFGDDTRLLYRDLWYEHIRCE